eukprot:c52986_g1_i1.p1 GENE.c52986_g1_i1~~c52986_g1_i1.p1  ORF type:complete len:691 (+),score=140.77 c52986_g1_i1:54-2126(+)
MSRAMPTSPRGPSFGKWDNGILWDASHVGTLIDTYDESVHTVYDIFSKSVSDYSSRPGAGYRLLTNREMIPDPKTGKKFEKLSFENEFTWISYGEWGEYVRNIGSGFVRFAGLRPGDRVLIYAETQRDWMSSCFACYNHNLTVVTAYATLGADAAAYAINSTKSKFVVADSKLLPILLTVTDKCPTLEAIVTMTDVDQDLKAKIEAHNIKVCTLAELAELGKREPAEMSPPSRDDVAMIMFTSGTTGNPKGVVLPHSAIVCAMAGLDIKTRELITAVDVYMAYLPLAHIMEVVAEISMVKQGCALGYGSPHTLTSTGVKLKEGQIGDIVVLKPTIVVFAPLILEKIYNSIQSKVANATGLKKWMFGIALSSGLKNFDEGQVGASFIWNSIVFKNVQALTGGRLRLILTGSAPLDGNVHKFVQTCFNCPVRQGYGATETCAASVLQDLRDNSVSSVGPPLPSCCIKLLDWEEGGYRFADKDNPAIGKPRGEILIGGSLVTSGYLVDPENPDPEIEEKNAHDFSVDEHGIRWFHTGDIGQVAPNGSISIIDRKKDLVKLQQGEYVALSKVEGVLKLSPYIENAMVHVDPRQNYCTALICPAFNMLVPSCVDKGWGNDAEELCSKPEVIAMVFESITVEAKGKLSGFEIPAKIHLVPPSRTWTPENDLLTAAMKLKRKPIINAHEAEIEALYK